jgi:DNA-binding XRE family transcriptional regulator
VKCQRDYSRDLINYRAHHDLKQRELEKILGVSRETINKIERKKQTSFSTVLETKIRFLLGK